MPQNGTKFKISHIREGADMNSKSTDNAIHFSQNQLGISKLEQLTRKISIRGGDQEADKNAESMNMIDGHSKGFVSAGFWLDFFSLI